MKSNVLLAGMLLTGAGALAHTTKSQPEPLPEVCKSIVTYNAQMLATNFNEDNDANPKHVKLSQDRNEYPILSVKSLGTCEYDRTLNPAWCQVAGGVPEVWQATVGAKFDGKEAIPFATVIATYNRGGCWVDKTEILEIK